jgi:hypothetical protein
VNNFGALIAQHVISEIGLCNLFQSFESTEESMVQSLKDVCGMDGNTIAAT